MCFNFLPEGCQEYDSVYFLRTSEGMVPLPNTLDEANSTLPGLFEIGLLNGHSLTMLQQLINKVGGFSSWTLGHSNGPPKSNEH